MAYKALVALHVLGVLAAVGSVVMDAGYFGAAALGSAARPGVDRYFAHGPGWSNRLIYPAAALGLVALTASHARVRFDLPWVWIPAAMWVVAALVLETVQRPAATVVSLDDGRRRAAAIRGMAASLVVLVLLTASAAVMTSKP